MRKTTKRWKKYLRICEAQGRECRSRSHFINHEYTGSTNSVLRQYFLETLTQGHSEAWHQGISIPFISADLCDLVLVRFSLSHNNYFPQSISFSCGSAVIKLFGHISLNTTLFKAYSNSFNSAQPHSNLLAQRLHRHSIYLFNFSYLLPQQLPSQHFQLTFIIPSTCYLWLTYVLYWSVTLFLILRIGKVFAYETCNADSMKPVASLGSFNKKISSHVQLLFLKSFCKRVIHSESVLWYKLSFSPLDVVLLCRDVNWNTGRRSVKSRYKQ